jgi:hypothetical protein
LGPVDSSIPIVDAARDTGGSHDATSDTNAPDTSVPDTSVPDTGVPDAPDDVADAGIVDAADAADAADTSPVDAGPLGSQTNPAASCKALHAAAPTAPDGTYFVTATGALADAFSTYCDMTHEGGGWTKVTSAVPEEQVRTLLGASGKQMVKCADDGFAYFASPSFAPAAPIPDAGAAVDAGAVDAGADADAGAPVVPWSWSIHAFVQVAGTWRAAVTDAGASDLTCGANPEYTQFTNCAWWGVGCGDGTGGLNKFFPGVLDSPSAGFCADTTSGHTNGGLVVCGSNNYRTYSVFVRAD